MLRRGSDEPSIRSLAAQNVPAQFNGLSRRTLLAGSARITVGSVLSSSPAVAQIEPPADGSHVRPSASLGSRIYSANPDHPGRADISDNPANVPPPLPVAGQGRRNGADLFLRGRPDLYVGLPSGRRKL